MSKSIKHTHQKYSKEKKLLNDKIQGIYHGSMLLMQTQYFLEL